MSAVSRVLLAAGALALVAADCPNGCSGHGLCASNDQCACDPTYSGADCSLRTCPFHYAFVDTPRGDLNHNGMLDAGVSGYTSVSWSRISEYELFPTNPNVYDASVGEAHFYAECSGQGTCDRTSGLCKCNAGYTGSACQRTACPSDCSGNGVCRTIREIATGAMNKLEVRSEGGNKWFSGVRTPFDYNRWDGNKMQACVCDPGFTGIDCSERLCPRGDDPMTMGSRWCGGATTCQWERQSFTLTSNGATTYRFAYTDSLNFTHYAYATVDVSAAPNGYVAPAAQAQSLPGPTTVAGQIMNALRAVPGGRLQRVEVYPQSDSSTGAVTARTFVVTFVGLPGAQTPLSITATSGAGSLDVNPDSSTGAAAVVRIAVGNYEAIECSSRGQCDRTAGVCNCFTGYYGASCEFQNALANGAGAGPSVSTSGSAGSAAGGVSASSVFGAPALGVQ